MISRLNRVLAGMALVVVSLACLPLARGEDCQTSSDMDEATRSALTSAGHCHEAVARLILLALDRIADGDLEHYQWALRQYAAELPG